MSSMRVFALLATVHGCMSTGSASNGKKLKCIFPFVTDGRTFSRCVGGNPQENIPYWCATSVGPGNKLITSDDCDETCTDTSECPDDHIGLSNGVCACPHGLMLNDNVCTKYRDDACMTSGHLTFGYKHACVFPFIEDGVTYNSCRRDKTHAGLSFCALSVDSTGIARKVEACDKFQCTPPAVSGSWGEWSACSITCGKGGSRTRKCSETNCNGADREMCEKATCPTPATPPVLATPPTPVREPPTVATVAPDESSSESYKFPPMIIVVIGLGMTAVCVLSVYLWFVGQEDRSHKPKTPYATRPTHSRRSRRAVSRRRR